MSYQALYRRYRPTNFDEIIGQEHITKVLKNQILQNKIGHAYLFCGTRGTGKTSMARIFAKAINCENKTNNCVACNHCASCLSLANPNSMDILEIDAASNNKVDEIRDLREKVKYPPVNCKYKVYIIDEVHMLTDQAFNALLKTLEEPPIHCVFILATTEYQKLPATILSRCMRLDFKLIEQTKLEEMLIKILHDLNINYEDEAISYIARAGQGSARDVLSIADMCIAYCVDNIKLEDVMNILGVNSKGMIEKIAYSIVNANVGEFLSEINKVSQSGKNLGALAKDLSVWFRNLIIAETCNNANEILKMPSEEFKVLKEQSNKIDFQLKQNCLNEFGFVEQNIKFSTNPQILIEIAGINSIAEIQNPSLKKNLK